MPESAEVIASKLVNGLIDDAEPNVIAKTLSEQSPLFHRIRQQSSGLWVGGTATLTRDSLTFVPNPLNRLVHTHDHVRTIPLDDIAAVTDRFGLVTRIVDVKRKSGKIFTFRCWGGAAFAATIRAAVNARRS